MDLDTEICVCFHVTLRKLWNYARREQPQFTALMTECLGAGTGCGSCVRLLGEIAALAPTGDLELVKRRLEDMLTARDVTRAERLRAKSDPGPR